MVQVTDLPQATLPLSDGDLALICQAGHLRQVAKAQFTATNASSVSYDNSVSGFLSTNVQQALDQITSTSSNTVPFTVIGAATPNLAVDCTAQLSAQLVAAAASNKTLLMGPGYFYARHLDPDSSIRLKGSGNNTVLLSAKDNSLFRTSTNQGAYQTANTQKFSVSVLDMGLSINPLTSDNTYVSRLKITVNAVALGVKSKMRARIFSNDIMPYTSAVTKKARYGEDFEILRVDANADGTSYIYVKGRLAWHDFYTTSITVNIWGGNRVYEFSDFKVMGLRKYGYVTKAYVTNPGSGYTSLPTITANNTGTGDTGVVLACSLGLDNIAITNAGSGYTNGTYSLSISSGSASKQGTATAVVSGNVVTSVTITNPGDKYLTAPTITLSGAGGTGAVLTATMHIQEIHVGDQTTNGLGAGTGHGSAGTYTVAPTISFSGGGGGTGAAGFTVINGECFDADYDVDTTVDTFHKHALSLWYCPGTVCKNLTFEDLWEGGLELRHSPFSIVDGIVGDKLPNFKTGLASPWQGRLGYLLQNQTSGLTRYSNIKSGVCRHVLTDGCEESGRTFVDTDWLTWGSSVKLAIQGVESNGCTGTTFGPHEALNGLYISDVIDINTFQGDQDESYRGAIIQLRGCNIHMNGIIIKGGTDGIRYQDTEQVTGFHILDNIIVTDLSDSTENSCAFRYPASTSTNRSKVIIGDMYCHRVGKAIRVDQGGEVYVIGKVTATDIGNVFIDLEDGGKLIVNESYSDFTLDNAGALTSGRKDYNLAGTCTLIVNKHTCRLGTVKNPTNTFGGTPTAATITIGERVIINDNAGTDPTLLPVSHSNFTVSSCAPTVLDLKIWDASYQFKRKIQTTETLTASRNFNLNLGDADRNFIMGGDAQIGFPTQTLTDAATIAWNVALGQVAKVTLGGSRTMGAPTNLRDGDRYSLRVIQDGTGSRTITWNAVFKWAAATAPTLSTGVNKVDLINFISDGTNLYLTSVVLDVR